jgi:2,5-dihydroxypyridine 5,6-dioxygenase
MSNRRISMNPSATPEIIGLFKRQLTMSNLKPGELCLVVTDNAFNPIYSDACIGAARDLGAETFKITLPFGGSLPKKSWGSAFRDADLIVYSTTHTLHYTSEMRAALEEGARALMVVIPLQAMERLIGDQAVVKRTKAGAYLMKKANKIRITSDAGTDLIMERGDRPTLAHYGLADESGHLDFWGAAMVETAEIEGSLEGTMVLDVGDQMFYMARYVENPVKVIFSKGRVASISGGVDALLLRKHLESFNEDSAWMAGHMGWGTDRRALWAAQALQFPEPGSSSADAEAFYGNIQIEIGSNNDVNFRGRNASSAHLGHCMLNSCLYLDDDLVIDHGEFVPPNLR